jgi:hypothetical protein
MGTGTQDLLMRSLIDDAIEEHEQTKKKQKTSKSVRFRDEDEVYEIPSGSGQVLLAKRVKSGYDSCTLLLDARLLY